MPHTALLVLFVASVLPLLPHPLDKDGWGLRIRPLECHQPYLARESIYHSQLIVVLLNQSKEERKYLLLDVACKSENLEVSIVRPNGQPLGRYSHASLAILFEDRWKLPAGQLVSEVFKFRNFGYHQLLEPGEYELRASFKAPEGVVVSPAVKLRVIEPSPDAILASQEVPLEGYEAKWPKAKQEQAFVQQIQIENRTWLFYRKFRSPELGGKVYATRRIVELPGKVELKVEGAFGERNPLTITYKDARSPTGTTKLVLNSISGSPWTEEEERWRQEQKAARIAPAPRPVKP